MSTRSLIHVKEDGITLVSIYVHCDGYPSGVGNNIKQALAGESFNGMDDLAAYLIWALKGGKKGNVYIAQTDNAPGDIDYTYTVTEINNEIHLTCDSGRDEPLYKGPLKDFDGKAVEVKEADG